jgi:hypothetical protein
MSETENTVKCTVDGCGEAAAILTPLPLCSLDSLRVAANYQRAAVPELRMSRTQALTEVVASPGSSVAELAERTGWPAEWIQDHRRRTVG